MNTKRLLFVSILFIACFLALPWAIMAEKTQEAPESMYIESSVYDGMRRRPPVELTHLNHAEEYGVDCSECHHEFTEGEPVRKCSECHKAEETDEVGVKLQDAMHMNCRACHQEQKEEKQKSSAPYTCAACHSEIDHFAFESPRKQPSVTFTHLYHQREYKIACASCHHRYENGENVLATGRSGPKLPGMPQTDRPGRRGQIEIGFPSPVQKLSRDFGPGRKTRAHQV